MIRRVLVANRGEIAVRVVRACRDLGIESVAAVSDADRDSLAARLADRAVCIGPAPAADSYLNVNAILAAAKGVGADAIHPGYGFLAENAAFIQACEDNGVTLVGPRAETVRTMGDKLGARRTAQEHGVPVVPGSGHVATVEEATAAARATGLPVMLKAAAGGGGRGLRVVQDLDQLRAAFETAAAEAESAFGDGTLYLERYVAAGRHIEIQVAADEHGGVIHLGERECSLQRRHQKIVEEAPAVLVPERAREQMREVAVRLTRGIGYRGVGTIEFLYDEGSGESWFLEMNTRVQVEHPVTEEVTGQDIVALQLRVAGGEPLGLEQSQVRFDGHAIECRVTAESPRDGFRPSPGRIEVWEPPAGPGVRVDSHCFAGYLVPPYYDSLLAKLIVRGRDRDHALRRTAAALREFRIEGLPTNLEFLTFLIDQPEVRTGAITTRWVEDHMDRFSITVDK